MSLRFLRVNLTFISVSYKLYRIVFLNESRWITHQFGGRMFGLAPLMIIMTVY